MSRASGCSFSGLACSSSSWPALRPPRARHHNQKRKPWEFGDGGFDISCASLCHFLACVFFFFLASVPPARAGLSFLFSCELWVHPAWHPPSCVPCSFGLACLEHPSSAQAHRGADRQPPSWRCCCSWLLLAFPPRPTGSFMFCARVGGTTAVRPVFAVGVVRWVLRVRARFL